MVASRWRCRRCARAPDFIEKPFTSDRLTRRGCGARSRSAPAGAREPAPPGEQVLEKKSVLLLGDSAPIQQIRRMVAAIRPDRGRCADLRRNRHRQGGPGQGTACRQRPQRGVRGNQLRGLARRACSRARSSAMRRAPLPVRAQRIGKIEFARGTLFLDEIENSRPSFR